MASLSNAYRAMVLWMGGGGNNRPWYRELGGRASVV
jgi:hypothetical protein